MTCGKCNNDLAQCSCEDLEQRFNQILKSEFIHIGSEYQARIRKNIEDRKSQTTKAE